mmetsp:Transcript_36947/g.88972  ORF Transcript_36947/g.88972 Transcript_36947/m.88972 type:complete len:225 (-) Transcript_36947:475-1149(-)
MLSAATLSWVKNSSSPSRSSCTNPVVFKYCARTDTIPPSPTFLNVPTPDADSRRPPCSRSRASSQCSKPRSKLSTSKAPPSSGAPAGCITPCLVNTSRMCGGTPVSTKRTLCCVKTCPRGRKHDPAAVASKPVTLLKSSTRNPVVSRARLGVPSRWTKFRSGDWITTQPFTSSRSRTADPKNKYPCSCNATTRWARASSTWRSWNARNTLLRVVSNIAEEPRRA